jgi:uncharacterized membrane protein YgcG
MPKYSGKDFELRIGRCKVSEDKGEYVVKAENSYGSREESALLDVEPAPEQPIRRAMSVEPSMRRKKIFEEVEGYKEAPDKKPMFHFPLRDRFIQEGVGFKLICSLDAKPMPEVIWSKNGKEIKPGGRYEVVTSLGICSLEVQTSEIEDAGRYSCRAVNSLGEEETICKLTINEKRITKGGTAGLGSFLSSYSSSYSSGGGLGGGGYSRRSSFSTSTSSYSSPLSSYSSMSSTTERRGRRTLHML